MEESGEITREKTRIYIGGLGGGVTEDDLRKTFSSLGDVISVDIVRTKDRSFAYFDFIPSSDKSLPKLFSTESVAKRQTTSTEKSRSEKKTLPLSKKRKSPHLEENC